MAVEERHDPQDDCRCSPRTIVVGTVYVGTDSQSRDARSRQVSTNDLQRDMCRALWLSRTRIPALGLARLWQTLLARCCVWEISNLTTRLLRYGVTESSSLSGWQNDDC